MIVCRLLSEPTRGSFIVTRRSMARMSRSFAQIAGSKRTQATCVSVLETVEAGVNANTVRSILLHVRFWCQNVPGKK